MGRQSNDQRALGSRVQYFGWLAGPLFWPWSTTPGPKKHPWYPHVRCSLMAADDMMICPNIMTYKHILICTNNLKMNLVCNSEVWWFLFRQALLAETFAFFLDPFLAVTTLGDSMGILKETKQLPQPNLKFKNPWKWRNLLFIYYEKVTNIYISLQACIWCGNT